MAAKRSHTKPGRPANPDRVPAKPTAFRLPPDVLDMATRAASARHISRNKLVELVLREALSAKFGRARPARAVRAADLFA